MTRRHLEISIRNRALVLWTLYATTLSQICHSFRSFTGQGQFPIQRRYGWKFDIQNVQLPQVSQYEILFQHICAKVLRRELIASSFIRQCAVQCSAVKDNMVSDFTSRLSRFVAAPHRLSDADAEQAALCVEDTIAAIYGGWHEPVVRRLAALDALLPEAYRGEAE